MNRWSVPRGGVRDFTLQEFYTRHQPANDPGFEERFHDLEIVMLNCRDAFGRVGFLARLTKDGELERCHMLALVHLHEDYPSLPAATFHHFRTYRHDIGPTSLSTQRFWRVISSLSDFGYNTEVSDRLEREDTLQRASWVINNASPSWHYLVFRHQAPEEWPTIVFVLRTRAPENYPGLDSFNCIISDNIKSLQDAVSVNDGRIDFREFYVGGTGELQTTISPDNLGEIWKEINSKTMLIIKLRQALSGMSEISLDIEYRD